jgi:hypothetical protein
MSTPPATLSIKDRIEENTHSLAEVIREWCRSQAKEWQKVPYECIACEGITGYLDRHAYAYRFGFWQLYSSTSGSYFSAYVDCSNGEIVSSFSAGEFLEKKIGAPIRVSDRVIIALSLDELDATKTLEELREYAARPPFKGYDQVKVEAWREGKRKALPLLSIPNPIANDLDEAKALL